MEERRRHMDPQIAGLKELLTQRFDGTDERLDALTAQVRETNGRLRSAETTIADMRPRLVTVEREIGDVRKSRRAAPESGEHRRIRVWDVGMVALGVSVAIAFFRLIGKL